jgi:hypothetical protein
LLHPVLGPAGNARILNAVSRRFKIQNIFLRWFEQLAADPVMI